MTSLPIVFFFQMPRQIRLSTMRSLVAWSDVAENRARYCTIFILQHRVRFISTRRFLQVFCCRRPNFLVLWIHVNVSVRSRLDVGTAEDPLIRDKIHRADRYFSKTQTLVQGFFSMLSTCVDISRRASVLIQIFNSRENAWLYLLFAFWFRCLYGLFEHLVSPAFRSDVFCLTTSIVAYYPMIINAPSLRLESLFRLWTSGIYKQEVIEDNLEEYINSGKKMPSTFYFFFAQYPFRIWCESLKTSVKLSEVLRTNDGSLAVYPATGNSTRSWKPYHW